MTRVVRSCAVVAAMIAATASCGRIVGIDSFNFVTEDGKRPSPSDGDEEDAGGARAGASDASGAWGPSNDSGVPNDGDASNDAAAAGPRITGVCADGELFARGYVADAAAEVIFLGQYGPGSAGDAGTTLVKVERTRPIVLALFSDQAVTWTLFVAPSAQIQRIVTMGSAPVELKGAPSVETKSGAAISWSGDDTPWTERGADIQAKTLGVKEDVGVGGYAACYRASSFSVRDP